MQDIDVRADDMNLEDMSIEDVLDEVRKAIDRFQKEVENETVVSIPRCHFQPDGDGDFHFWIGCQVK